MQHSSLVSYFPRSEHYTNLNHGSFGVSPTTITERIRSLREDNAMCFGKFRSERFDELLDYSLFSVAETIGAPKKNLVYTRNTSEALEIAVNAALQKHWLEGCNIKRIVTTNHEYSSTNILLTGASNALSVPLVMVPIDEKSRGEATSAIVNEVDENTLLVMSHITSPWAERLDLGTIESMLPQSCFMIVDAAHSPGCFEIPANVFSRALVAMSLHKWAFFPLGTGALSVPPHLQKYAKPLVHSWWFDESFAKRFSWTGTDDYFNFLVGGEIRDWFTYLRGQQWDFGISLSELCATHLDAWPEFRRVALNEDLPCMASWRVQSDRFAWKVLKEEFRRRGIYVWLGQANGDIILRLSFPPYITRKDVMQAVEVCDRWRNGGFDG